MHVQLLGNKDLVDLLTTTMSCDGCSSSEGEHEAAMMASPEEQRVGGQDGLQA